MERRWGNKNLFITIGIATAMIVLCAVLLNTMLVRAAEPKDDAVYTDTVSSDVDMSATGAYEVGDLTVHVDMRGNELPAGGVTAQYAVAAAAEIAERVYDKPFQGRVNATLDGYVYALHPGLRVWAINAEVDGGVVSVSIEVESGIDRHSGYYSYGSEEEAAWSYFDSWTPEIAAADLNDVEKQMVEIEKENAELSEAEIVSPEEEAEMNRQERPLILEFAASMADTPYGPKAMELVDELDIGDGAKAVSGDVVQEGSASAGSIILIYYVVDVKLDDGKYVQVTLAVDDMQLLGYQRSDIPYIDAMYGV
jgi:hypothetical protein